MESNWRWWYATEGFSNLPGGLAAPLLEIGYEGWWLLNWKANPEVARIATFPGMVISGDYIPVADVGANFPFGLAVAPDH